MAEAPSKAALNERSKVAVKRDGEKRRPLALRQAPQIPRSVVSGHSHQLSPCRLEVTPKPRTRTHGNL